MAETQFWHLASPESTARYAEWVDGEMRTQQVVCPISEGHRRGGKRLTNLSVALRGEGSEDFVWTWYSECLVQDRVVELFRKRGFTGFDVKPVNAKFKRTSEREPPKLWELVVTGWAGMASAQSGIVLDEHCEGCGLLHYSQCKSPEKLIDVSQWDGSDLFIVWPLPKFIFVTNRVAQLICANRLSGAVVQPAEDLRFSEHVIPGFSPGRLSYRMSPERARELGKALGIE